MRINLFASGSLIVLAAGIAFGAEAPCAGKSGTNWVRHYTEACPELVDAANDCTLCHTSIEVLNPYGLDLALVDNLPWLIDDLDSDRDGRTNLQEIEACTPPGERRNVPAPAAAWGTLKARWR